MNKLRLLIGSFIALTGLVTGGVLVAQPAGAQSPEQSACEGSGGKWSNGNCSQGSRTLTGTIKTIGNILIFITGAVSVVMIILGGLRYTISNGDQGSVTSAKNTILYAVVGLIIAATAYAIVNFVLSSI